MKKTLLSLALIAAVPMTVAADVTIYGRANVSVDLLDDGADYSEFNVSSNSSRLGFKGAQDFEGVTGIFQIEQEIDFSDSGASWASRDTFVGVRAGFGTVRIGKFDTPFKVARGPANLFGDQLGDMRNLTRVGNARFDERTPNTVEYQTPNFNGLQFNLAYSLHEGTEATDDQKDQAVSFSTTYKSGPIDFAIAYETFGEDTARGDRDAVRVAAAYTFGAAKVVGFYQVANHVVDTLDSDVVGLGLEYKLTSKTTLRGNGFVRSADADERDSTMLVVGIEHALAKPLRIYANYASVRNDDLVALTPWAQARTTAVPGVPGETASGLSAGLRFDF